MANATCSVDGCERSAKSALGGRRGMCRLHHRRQQKWGDPLFVRERLSCTVDGCGSAHYGHGLCSMHWQRQRNKGTTEPSLRNKDPYNGTDLKTCRQCLAVKPRSEFSKNRRRGDGVSSYCCACHQAKSRAWVRNNPEAARRSWRRTYLRKTYGITVADYEQRLALQGGVCAICAGPPPVGRVFYCIDHDHRTGKIRGLLCSNCNVLIGYAQDDVERLGSAIDYLRKGAS